MPSARLGSGGLVQLFDFCSYKELIQDSMAKKNNLNYDLEKNRSN
jgi:hypothetical protein